MIMLQRQGICGREPGMWRVSHGSIEGKQQPPVFCGVNEGLSGQAPQPWKREEPIVSTDRSAREVAREERLMRLRWHSMIGRCTKPDHPQWKDYGGRGITVCAKWLNFGDFLSDLGFPPPGRRSMDRIDNDGNYEPSNVRWATAKEQNNNRRSQFRDKIECAHGHPWTPENWIITKQQSGNVKRICRICHKEAQTRLAERKRLAAAKALTAAPDWQDIARALLAEVVELRARGAA